MTTTTHPGTTIDAGAYVLSAGAETIAVVYDRDEVVRTVAAITRRDTIEVSATVLPCCTIDGIVVVEGAGEADRSVTVTFPTIGPDSPREAAARGADTMTDLVHDAAVALVRPASTPARTTEANRWGGFDAPLSDGRLLRVCREDREGSVDVLVFNNASNLIVVGEMTVSTGVIDGDGLGRVIRAFADATGV